MSRRSGAACNDMLLRRRSFLRRSLLAGAWAHLAGCGSPPLSSFPPIRRITRGPEHHWFGYYDKLAFDPTERYVLGMRVGFEGRAPTSDDAIRVGMIDLQDGDRWIDLGHTTAWSWQQGCMLQWLPGGPGGPARVVWNVRDGDGFGSRIADVQHGSGRPKSLPRPLYCISPDGRFGLSIDFVRAGMLRPGYGYARPASSLTPSPARGIPHAPDDDGIWRVEFAAGESRLVLSIAAAADVVPAPHDWDRSMRHWVHHVVVSPSGTRMAFLHCAMRRDGWFGARLMTATAGGDECRVVVPGARVSHFCWRDDDTLLAWATVPGIGPGFYLLSDRGDQSVPPERVGRSTLVEDGHCTFLQDRRWILSDTYSGILRQQVPYLYDTATDRKHLLGAFAVPGAQRGPHRCDLHPRASPSGRLVAIDSAHADGRQIYLIDVSGVVNAPAES